MSPGLVLNNGNVVEESSQSNHNDDACNVNRVSDTSKSAVLHRSLHHEPLRVISAKGNYLHLNNGQSVFDATGGAAVACLGHGDQRVKAAVAKQMDEVSYCHSLFYGTSAAENLAGALIESTVGEMAKAFIISSGSEAIEAALKLTRQYHLEKQPSEPERCHFIARQQSYHGTTLGALAVGGHVARRALYEPMLSATNSLVSPCFAYRGKVAIIETDEAYVQRLADELDAEFQRIGPRKVAAFIAEPVVGAALGCVPAVQGYFKAVRRVCDKYGALLIMDEIMSGCGRSGPEPTERYPDPLHVWQDPLIGVVPDLMALGKGLGGGYQPVAAVLANHRVVDALYKGSGAFSHGQTYQGHPVACGAAAEVQRIIKEDNLVANVRRQGALLGKLLKEKVGTHWAVGDVRGKGLFWGVEFVSDKASKTPFKSSKAVAMGVHELVDGRQGDHIIISPAYTVTEEDIRYIVDTTAAVINKFFRQLAGDLSSAGRFVIASNSCRPFGGSA